MKVKNINPVEQHVEKGILALCVLAAGYLGYSALTSPLTFTDGSGDSVAVRDVEDQISQKVEEMNKKREENRTVVEHMVNIWAEPINPNRDNNLDPKLVATAYPVLNPGQRIEGGKGPLPPGPEGGTIVKILPMPQAPEAPVVAEAMPPGHFLIKQLDAMAAAPAPAPGTPAPMGSATDVVKELKPVKVTAVYDLKGNFATMNGEGIPADNRISPDLTKDRVVYLGVQLERVEVNPDINQDIKDTDWQDLPGNMTEKLPPMTWGDDNVTKATLDALHSLRGVILEPRFYQSTTAPVTTDAGPAEPPSVLPLVPTGGARPAPPPGTVVTPPAPGGAPGPTTPTDTGPTLSPIQPVAILDEATTATAPLVAYDTTAVPGHQYKYRMRVLIANPAYHQGENFKDSGLNEQPALKSDWSPESAVFTMEPDQTFYVSAAKLLSAKFKIWQYINAKWEHAESDIVVGDVVNATAVGEKTATQEPTETQLSTDYLVVDSSPGKVVLMNIKDGKLEVRDAGSDKAAAEKRTQRDKDATDAEAAPKTPAP